MKIPSFPRTDNIPKGTEELYNWCYELYLALKEAEKNEQKTAESDEKLKP